MGSVAALGGSPASAAPGDASATGVRAAVTVNLLGQPAVGLNASVGSVAAPPVAAESLVDAAIGIPATAAVTAGVVNVEASSSPSLADGEAAVTGAAISVPVVDLLIGGPILGTGTGVIRASADCASGAAPTTSFGDTATLVVVGQPVVLDVDGEATVGVETALLGPVGTVSIRTDVSNVSTETAEAVALLVDIDINVASGGRVVDEVGALGGGTDGG